MNKPSCAVFTGGGTGGHVFPGLAVAESLQERWGGQIVWIGSARGIERDLVEEAGLDYYPIPSGKFRRYFSWQNLIDLFKIAAGFVRALFLLAKLKPRLLFSKGGFVSVPPVAAAKLLGIPVFSHESDENPGLATRLNQRASRKILLAYAKTAEYFPPALKARTVVVGNPVRQGLFQGDAGRARERFGIPEGLPLVLVLGGSLGARRINDLLETVAPRFHGRAFFVHQTGQEGSALAEEAGFYFKAPFFRRELADLLCAATVLISRAGAGSLWEAAAVGLPVILIPLGAGSRGDQLRNAELFAKAGAALNVGPTPDSEELSRSLDDLLASPERRERMKEALAAFDARGAAGKVADILMEELRHV